jgi:hypothetical protein
MINVKGVEISLLNSGLNLRLGMKDRYKENGQYERKQTEIVWACDEAS